MTRALRSTPVAVIVAMSLALLVAGCGGAESEFKGGGKLEGADCYGIRGWAYNKSSPDEAIDVDILAGDEKLATIKAQEARPELAKFISGSTTHGFRLPLPDRLRDGQAHTIRVVFTQTQKDIPNSPQTIRCEAGEGASPGAGGATR